MSSILPDNLVDIPAIDRRCETLAYGLGKSQNAILAKLATRHLTADGSSWRASGTPSASTRPSPSSCPSSRRTWTSRPTALEFARTAAGFWHSTLSPLHGALLAATIANRGDMPTPTLIDRAVDADGAHAADAAAGGPPPPSSAGPPPRARWAR